MTEEPDDWLEPQAPEEAEGQPPLLRVKPAYRNVLRVRFALLWVPIVIAVVVLDQAIDETVSTAFRARSRRCWR
jgi:hypothetical protein